MISATIFAALLWGSIVLLGLVFAWVVRSLRRGAGSSRAIGPEVNR